jgi:hypothetical protein
MLQQGTDQKRMDQKGTNKPGAAGEMTLEQRVVEDPLLRFVSNYWKQIIVVLAAAAVILWVKNVFETTHTEAMRSSADAYSTVQDEFASLLSLQADLAKAKQTAAQKPASDAKDAKTDPNAEVEKVSQQFKEAKEKLGKSIEALSFAKAPYSSMSKLYAGLSASLDRDAAGARSALGDLVLTENSAAKQSQDLIHELATIVLARTLVDDEKGYSEGRALLKLLTKNGDGVGVSAAISLARVSNTDAEKKEATEILTDLQNRAPEQNALIEKELQALSAS